MKKKISSIFFYLLLFCIIPLKGFAYNNDPKQFISEIVIETKKILNSNSDKKTKTEQLSQIAIETVDIKGLAYYTLGNYRSGLTSEQLKEYLDLFEKYFLKSFTSRLADYSDPKIEVLSVEVLNPKYTMVYSKLLETNERPEIKINWRVYTKDPLNPLIRDLVIEGLSLARTQKEEFSSVIESNNGDVSKLFSTLREFINN